MASSCRTRASASSAGSPTRPRSRSTIDGAVDERAQINSPDGKLEVGLKDAYGDVVLSGAAVARAGYFQPWVDPEALVPDTARELIDHPIESRGMRATEGYQTPGLPPGRSLGVAIHLDPEYLLGEPVKVDGPALGVELAVQNGADEFASNNDNDLPAVSLAAVLRMPHDSWLMAAGRWNQRSIGDLPFRRDESDYQGTAGLHVDGGPGVARRRRRRRSTRRSIRPAARRKTRTAATRRSMFAIPAALPFAIGYRFGVLDPSSLIVTDRVMEHTVGAVLGVPSYRMRFQLQVVHVVEQAARDLANDRDPSRRRGLVVTKPGASRHAAFALARDLHRDQRTALARAAHRQARRERSAARTRSARSATG